MLNSNLLTPETLAQIPLNTKICIVAGEVSGDQLGAGLVAQLKNVRPDLEFVGIGGDLMRAQGVTTWYDISDLSYFGVVDVVLSLPKILRVIKQTKTKLKESQAQLYIGIDNPDFNLRLETYAKQELGIKTIQYVSPSVWAWRQGRIETIKQACDLVLCLLPFEKDFYDQHAQAATYVGHRLANELGESLSLDAQTLQARLNQEAEQRLHHLTGGQVSVSQAKRLMDARKEKASYSEILEQEEKQREAQAQLEQAQAQEQQEQTKVNSSATTHTTPAQEQNAQAKAASEGSNSQVKQEQATQSKPATQAPKEQELATKEQASKQVAKEVSQDAQKAQANFSLAKVKPEDFFLGLDGKYYLAVTPEEYAQLQQETAKTSAAGKAKAGEPASSALSSTQTFAVKDNQEQVQAPSFDYLANARQIQDFVQSLPSAQKAQEDLAKANVYTYQGEASLDSSKVRIAILPGSRSAEIENIFAWYICAIRVAIREQVLPADVELVVPVAKEKLKKLLFEAVADYPEVEVKFVDRHAHQVLQTSALAIVSSGTATLDTLLCHTPMVVGYRLGSINFFLAKRLIKTPYVALANIVMGQELAKELIQEDLTAANLVREIKPLLDYAYNLQVRQIYYFKHLQLQKDSDVLAAKATLELLAKAD
ncbi:hypothetical protein CKF54_00075 [Psittacicella hinzii]|uniref:Lipid-A-disaccharide synthase n=1 Tax=Psittacicella hinzii TaxID=2028575 RepID=A0A3A1YB32_9GAMM|nr:hypothetical protein [Psittacicella hinzii]RIY34556.1 hypothetical protein CKF54_00075 [Psittacicella hinzii]